MNNIIRFALQDLFRNKLRTLLTTLGILIGITSVILLISFTLGLKKYIADEMNSLGSNLVMVLPGKIKQVAQMNQNIMQSPNIFDEKDVISLKRISTIKSIAPVYGRSVKMSYGGESELYQMIASSAEIFDVLNFDMEAGVKFDKAEAEKGNKVVIIGATPAKKIFGGSSEALGKTAKLNDQSFRVIGVIKSQGGGIGGGGMDQHLIIPYKSALSFNPNKKFLAIYLQAENESVVSQTKDDIQKVLLKRFKEDEFSIMDQKQMLDSIQSIFGILNIVLVGIAAISLLVGGIGVMNIMYVSVVERIQEIGIRRAVGATRIDILLLFLLESILLSILGAVLGLGISFGVVTAIQSIFPAYINMETIALALGVSSVIGIVFGVFPARRAASLSPIEAIRYEPE